MSFLEAIKEHEMFPFSSDNEIRLLMQEYAVNKHLLLDREQIAFNYSAAEHELACHSRYFDQDYASMEVQYLFEMKLHDFSVLRHNGLVDYLNVSLFSIDSVIKFDEEIGQCRISVHHLDVGLCY